MNVATPLTAATEAFDTFTPPDVNAAVTVDVSVVTTLPLESSIWTTGCWARTVPLTAADDGWVVTASWVAGPAAAAGLTRPTISPEEIRAAATMAVAAALRPLPSTN